MDHGFIKIIDAMGSDAAIVQAARVSYGEGTKTQREDLALIKYLMKYRHTSPFEMCEIKLHIKLPIFVARQWIRHRTANVNEVSARYSVLPEESYIPDLQDILPQSANNKQGRGGAISQNEVQNAHDVIEVHSKECYQVYKKLLGEDDGSTGIAREIARVVLPLNMYTEWYWKIDLHNLLHFVELRIHPHAQYEIRVYAEILLEIIKEWCPFTYEAFQEYVLHARTLSRSQIAVLKQMISSGKVPENSGLSKREIEEIEEILQ